MKLNEVSVFWFLKDIHSYMYFYNKTKVITNEI